MPAAKLNLYAEQGATFYRKLTFKDADGNKIDLTGNVYNGQVRKATGDATILATFTCTVLNQVSNKGEVELEISSLDMASLPLKVQKNPERVTEKFAYDVEVTFPSTKKERVIEGVFEVSPEVSV